MAAYTIIKSDGTVLTTIPEGTINTTASTVALPGKNFSGYGLYVDTDLVRMTEHFSATTVPANPIRGQIWYDLGNLVMKYCPTNGESNGANWISFAGQGGQANFTSISVSGNIGAGNITLSGDLSSNSINSSYGTIGNLTVPSTSTFGGNATFNSNVSIAGNLNMNGSNIANVGTITANTANLANINSNLIIANTANLANINSNLIIANTANVPNINSNIVTANTFTGGNFTGTFSAPGSNTWVLFNDGGNIGADGGFTYDKTTDSMVLAGNLTVNGTLTTVNSTTLQVVDPIISMGGGPNGTPLTSNDGKDRGSELKYYSGTPKSAFMGWDNSAGNFIFYSDATIVNEVVTGGTLGNITMGNINAQGLTLPPGSSMTTTSLTTGAPATAGSITGTWTLTPGSTMQATYADLAERHHADAEYSEGTIVKVGGENEITKTTHKNDLPNVLGVVSKKYAYLMNAEAGPDETHPAVACIGRVPVRIVGPIKKGDKITVGSDGCGTASMNGQGFGWALESNDETGEKLVMCVIK